MERRTQVLKDWIFAFGDREKLQSEGRKVEIPHTWNVEEGTEEAVGCGWYQYDFIPSEDWKDKTVQVQFQAVSFDTEVYLNEKKIGEHLHSGYTPFTVDLTEHLVYGKKNHLVVGADNTYSTERLPYMRSFDWCNDGGMIRNAYLIVTGKSYIKKMQVTAAPKILKEGNRQEEGSAVLGIQVFLGGEVPKNVSLEWELVGDTIQPGECLYSGHASCEGSIATVPQTVLEYVKYWHFDFPVLYTLKLRLRNQEGIIDTMERSIGFREFRVADAKFFLNGEQVRLCGTEWMPGSDPTYGAAEPKEQLEKMLVCLKTSNCVFTRFHWQQDDSVYDWCDRHGMLVQEEVPFWGKEPENAGEQQFAVFKKQAEEMIDAHGTHPSIISWGVGNELNAQKEPTLRYIKNAIAYMKQLDASRAVNYVSNTFLDGASTDGTTYGDILMINEYTGTWMPEGDADTAIQSMIQACPFKPVVPSEFGLCEPAFSGGDARREEIFLEKMHIYRKYPQVAGSIYFCLNDYRTQVGEEGEGKLRRRVHGSTGLSGVPKPSYDAVQRECAPFAAEVRGEMLHLTCRKDLPCYAMKGYFAEITAKDGTVRQVTIPDLLPGMTWSEKMEKGCEVRIYRPTKDLAGVERAE